MRIPWFLILTVLVCFGMLSMSGCATRTTVVDEPDTEWILAQYRLQPEEVVNARRIKEGW